MFRIRNGTINKFMLQALAVSQFNRASVYLASSMTMIQSPKTLLPYKAPTFAKHFKNVPKHRLKLANLPTPLQNIPLCNKDDVEEEGDSVLQTFRDLNAQLLIKRDDMSAGVELGGNKIRKLEFLLADALQGGYDSAITIGGEQSNHCRATAAACRMVGIKPHLILRTKRANKVANDEDEFGFVGNILFDRMAGATIHTCTPGEYGRIGSQGLINMLCEDLESSSDETAKKVYKIPVGGSNALGSWGYIDGVNEFLNQLDGDDTVDHVVFACGSGGSAAGIALGLSLAYHDNDKVANLPKIHAVGVCDDPDYFYNTVSEIAKDMGLDLSTLLPASDIISIEGFVRNHMIAHQGKGLGYASSTKEELDFIVKFALETGVVLDPVYSGKALFQFIREMKKNPEMYRNSRIVFWHTGGSLGAFEKIEALKAQLESISPVTRMDIYGRK